MRKRGEITVFLCAVVALVGTVLLVTWEAARTSAGAVYAQMVVKASVESGLGEFYRPLWEEYRILAFYEKEPLEGRIEHYLNLYAAGTSSFLAFGESEVEVTKAVYLTEQGGYFLQESGADYMKYHVAAEALQDVTEQFSLVEQIRRAAGFVKELAAFSEQVLEAEEQLRKIRQWTETVVDAIGDGKRIAKELASQAEEITRMLAAGLSEEEAMFLVETYAWTAADQMGEVAHRIGEAWPKLMQAVETYQKQAAALSEKVKGAMEAFQSGDYTGAVRSLLEEQLDKVKTYSSEGGSRYGEVQEMKVGLLEGVSQIQAFEGVVADMAAKETVMERLAVLETWSASLGDAGIAIPSWLKELGDLSHVTKDVVDFDVKVWSQEELLRVAIGEDASISDAKLGAADLLSGGMTEDAGQTSGVVSSLLFRSYLVEEMSHFQDQKSGHALAYELEYLIGGHLSDRENLLAVVGDLLLLREGVNFLGYLSDPVKVQEAAAVAATMVGATGNPFFVQVLQTGVLAVWALEDAAQDVRAMMQGEKVPLVTLFGEEWVPLDYKGYLAVLLGFSSAETLRLGCMDLIQATLRQEDADFDLKKCVYGADLQVCVNSGNVLGALPWMLMDGEVTVVEGQYVVELWAGYDS